MGPGRSADEREDVVEARQSRQRDSITSVESYQKAGFAFEESNSAKLTAKKAFFATFSL